MSILPILTPRQFLGVLLKAGFRIIKQRGSHILLKHPTTQRSTTIAMHTKDFSRKIILKILRQAGISVQELLRLLKK